MAELLAESDYVVSIMPSTPQTTGMLSGNVLAPCRNKVRSQLCPGENVFLGDI